MPSFTLSAALVEEIFQTLVKQPFISVAPVIGKLQAEIAQQQQNQASVQPTEHTLSDIAARAGARRPRTE